MDSYKIVLLIMFVLVVLITFILIKKSKKTQEVISVKKPSESRPVPDEAPVRNENPEIHFQVRMAVEHNILPAKISQEPIYMITAIIAEKGAFINNYYRAIYSQQKMTSPYSFEDFNVSVPFDIGGAKAVRIDMPTENIKNTLCERIYIVYNDSYTKHLYVTIEKSDNSLKMCMWLDKEHEVIGDISDNELLMLEQLVADEEIAENNYSDVIEKLMSDTKPPVPLLTEPSEISEYAKVFFAALVEVQKLKQDNKREDALKLIKEVIKKEAVRYENTDLVEYHSFNNSFDVLLYANLYHPYNPEKQEKKQIVAMQVDLAMAYLVYGVMMLEQRQYDKAIDIFYEGLKVNPVNLQLLFALADAYRGKGFLKSYLATIAKAHSCAIRKADISRIYRAYAYYYTQIKDYDTAAMLIYAGKYFDAQGFTQSLRELEKLAEKTYKEPDTNEIKAHLNKIDIFWGAKELVISVVSLLDKEYTQNRNEQGMKMCAELKRELTFDD